MLLEDWLPYQHAHQRLQEGLTYIETVRAFPKLAPILLDLPLKIPHILPLPHQLKTLNLWDEFRSVWDSPHGPNTTKRR